MSIRPQDVLVAVKLALSSRQTYPELAAALEMSLSEVHAAVKRATDAGLVGPNRNPNRIALLDFLLQGAKRTFVPKRGPLTRGMPTAHGAPPLDRLVGGSGAEPPPVWPDPEGTVRGESFSPLYRSVPRAARKDPKLYEVLCLIDAIRGGRARDYALAEQHLRELLLPAGDPRSPSAKTFSLNDPRRQRILRELTDKVGDGTADFYRSAVELLALDKPPPATSHLVAHLAGEIESSLRKDIITEVMATNPSSPSVATRGYATSIGSTRSCGTCGRPLSRDAHVDSIRSVLTWLEIPIDGVVANDWLALAGESTDSSLAKRRHRQNLDLPRPIDWDFWLRFEGILDEILDAFARKYVGVLDRLDEIAAVPSPNAAHARRLRGKLPQTSNALEYFFGKLNIPEWIKPLETVGFFRRPPDPIRTGDGVRYPSWPALQYLARVAEKQPNVVAEIALAVPKTENVRVHVGLLQVALALPPELAAAFVDRVDDWLDVEAPQMPGSGLVERLSDLVEKLAAGGQVSASLRVMRAMLRPVRPTEREEGGLFRRDPESRLSDWDLMRTLGRLPPTIASLGESSLTTLMELLEEAISIKHEGVADPWDYYPRTTAIENHSPHPSDDLGAHLVTAVRDAAVQLIVADPGRLSATVVSLEARRWAIFQRLALFLLERFAEHEPSLVASRILDRSRLESAHLEHEYARLLRKWFSRLDSEQRKAFLALIQMGPAETDGLPAAGADIWRLRWLVVILADLPHDWRVRFEALKTRYGGQPAPDDEASSPIMVRPESPFSKDDLAVMTPEQMVDAVASLPGDSRAIRSEVGKSVAAVVEQNVEIYATNAMVLERLDPSCLWSVFHGFAQAVRARRAFDWTSVVDLCVWATSESRTNRRRKHKPSEQEGDWTNTRLAALRLLSDGMSMNNVPIPIDLRRRVWSAIVSTVDDPDGKGIDGAAQSDPMSQSLNHVRGVAIRTVIDYALWQNRKSLSRGLPHEVRKTLENSLADPSTAVRAVFGDRIAMLASLDPTWCKRHVRAMFRRDPEGRDPAWETYLEYDRLSLSGFRILRWRYKAEIGEFGSDTGVDRRTQKLAGHVASHLAQLYWHGKIAFGERDHLLDRFFDSAPPSVTGGLMEQIGHWLHDDTPPSRESLVRLKALWVRRAVANVKEEMAAFSWWFSSGRFEESWAIETFWIALGTGIQPQYAPHLGERLVELLPRHLLPVVSSLELIVKADERGWSVLNWRREARTILTAALASNDARATSTAMAVVNRLCAAGYSDFRDLLRGERASA